jgi:hypothetical protein
LSFNVKGKQKFDERKTKNEKKPTFVINSSVPEGKKIAVKFLDEE